MQKWHTQNGIAKIGDTLEFSKFNSVSGKEGERAKIVKYKEVDTFLDFVYFDDNTHCAHCQLWDSKIVERAEDKKDNK